MTRHGMDSLVKLAGRTGHYVSTLGGERYQVATERGRIVLRSGTYAQTIRYLQTGGVISEADAMRARKQECAS
jgi:hypothetical protein